MPSIGRILAYVLAGVPAAIGTWFVARHGYVISDTAIDGAGSAFLAAMIAIGAYLGPVVVLVSAENGHKRAAGMLAVLAALAMLANWYQTLDAIANRGAGSEAERSKASANEKDARAELARITAERAAMTFTPATSEAVTAARDAVTAAERSRIAECEKRGKFCRERETSEQNARDVLAAVLENRAATEKAAKLDAAAATIREKLAKAPAVRESPNALRDNLGALLSLKGDTVATLQQMFLSAIVELLIAAALTLPELLRRKPAPVAHREEEMAQAPDATAGTTHVVAVIEAPKTGNVPEILAIALQPAKGQRLEIADAFQAYAAECRSRAVTVLPPEQFVGPLQRFCQEVGIRTRRRGEKVWLVDVQLAG